MCAWQSTPMAAEMLTAVERLMARIARLADYRVKHRAIQEAFDAVPIFDYTNDKEPSLKVSGLPGSWAQRYRPHGSGGLHRAPARHRQGERPGALCRKISRNDPGDRFDDLKRAFPCIIARIRDYAEYVPLEAGLFDLAIIDEAGGQVSIASSHRPAISPA